MNFELTWEWVVLILGIFAFVSLMVWMSGKEGVYMIRDV